MGPGSRPGRQCGTWQRSFQHRPTLVRCMTGAYSKYWQAMLAVNAAVMLGVALHKITLPPYIPYIHLLVDYHFGFIKRGMIGAILGLFTARVPIWLVFALAGGV